jgi:hypothetical protein
MQEIWMVIDSLNNIDAEVFYEFINMILSTFKNALLKVLFYEMTLLYPPLSY